ncbi:DBP2 [Ecytonucleospora hepatopenaei]|uniref:RNA helicase n=1 Tax=Ecytonucleospora hepatopenaei TaxID=646526 RepID=A0A1W0E9A0_9MICR|nr:DBP2 [Ecytonucleospora hepatopenaei]
MSYYGNNYGNNYGGNRYRGSSRGGSRYTRFGEPEPIEITNEPIDSFNKNFLKTRPNVSEKEIEEFRTKNEMKIVGKEIPAPAISFGSVGFDQEIVDFFEKTKKYEKPTAIQSQGWTMALSGRDMIGIAATGSGKTFSFLLPAFIHAVDQPPLRKGDGPIVVILAPTRELATQIEQDAAELTNLRCFRALRTFCVYGGAGIVPQKRALLDGVEVLIATPGRLIDLNQQGFAPLSRCTFLVLDEADRMLDMGFEPQLNQIIPQTHKNRQTLMWSATWPKEVKSLAYKYTSSDAIQVTIGDEDLTVNSKIEQHVEVVSSKDKKSRLMFLLQDYKDCRVLIFANRKATCDRLEYELREKRYGAIALHGDKSQAARDAIFSNFKNGREPILIATDVAARGLDVKDIKIVINYDLPTNIEDYVHRVGRTCRGDAKDGKAFTMFSPEEDAGNSRKFCELLKKGNVAIPQELQDIAARSVSKSNSRYGQRGGQGYGRNSYGYGNRRGSYGGGQRRDGYNDRFNSRY